MEAAENIKKIINLNQKQKQILFSLNKTENELLEIFKNCQNIINNGKQGCMSCRSFDNCNKLRMEHGISYGSIMRKWNQ